MLFSRAQGGPQRDNRERVRHRGGHIGGRNVKGMMFLFGQVRGLTSAGRLPLEHGPNKASKGRVGDESCPSSKCSSIAMGVAHEINNA